MANNGENSVAIAGAGDKLVIRVTFINDLDGNFLPIQEERLIAVFQKITFPEGCLPSANESRVY